MFSLCKHVQLLYLLPKNYRQNFYEINYIIITFKNIFFNDKSYIITLMCHNCYNNF